MSLFSTHRRIALVLLAAMVLTGLFLPRLTAAQVIGDTYTSPQYGYTITLGNGWEVIEESSEIGYDSLLVSDFERFVRFAGGPAPSSPGVELASSMLICEANEVSNCADVLDENGAPIRYVDDNRAYAIRSFDVEQEGVTFPWLAIMKL